MYDEQTIDQAIEAFHSLSGDDMLKLEDLNAKIQKHTGEWGERMGGEKIADNRISERWVKTDPLISELIHFMLSKGLIIIYVWADWNDSHTKLFESEDPDKYDAIDLRNAFILISGAVRKERASSGSHAWAFESGGFIKLINRLVQLAEG